MAFFSKRQTLVITFEEAVLQLRGLPETSVTLNKMEEKTKLDVDEKLAEGRKKERKLGLKLQEASHLEKEKEDNGFSY